MSDIEQRARAVPFGQTPLDSNLHHRYLDVIKEGEQARDSGAGSPYHGHSLEHCLHAVGWVERDLCLAHDATKAELAELREVLRLPTMNDAVQTALEKGEVFIDMNGELRRFIQPEPAPVDPLVEEEDPIDALVDLLAPVLKDGQGMSARARENRFRNAIEALLAKRGLTITEGDAK